MKRRQCRSIAVVVVKKVSLELEDLSLQAYVHTLHPLCLLRSVHPVGFSSKIRLKECKKDIFFQRVDWFLRRSLHRRCGHPLLRRFVYLHTYYGVLGCSSVLSGLLYRSSWRKKIVQKTREYRDRRGRSREDKERMRSFFHGVSVRKSDVESEV